MMPGEFQLPTLPKACLTGTEAVERRLRKAREAAGLTQADVADRLKMPVRVVRSLEAEDWSRLGAPVFVRGQLRSYSRLLGLTTAPMMAASGVAPVEPPYLSRGCTRRRCSGCRAGRASPGLHRADRRDRGSGLAGDAAAPGHRCPRCRATGCSCQRWCRAPRANAPTLASIDPSPLVASLAPLPRLRQLRRRASSLQLSGDSWVQITAPDGRKLEESLLHAGKTQL